MLNSENAKQLEANVLERLKKMFPEDESPARLIATISARTAIVTLQEYEKMCESQESDS